MIRESYCIVVDMSSFKNRNEQIPSRQKEDQTQRMVEKQNQVAGKRRESRTSPNRFEFPC
jgi:hypothetical protein